jgi:hypothetical protein
MMSAIKKIPYNQMIAGLDRLLFGSVLTNQQEAEDRIETIEAYLEGTGYCWDDIINRMIDEEVPSISTKFRN